MLVQELRQELIGNNLANVNTGGYKSRGATLQTFPEVLLYRLNEKGTAPVGYYTHGVMLDRTHDDFSPGKLEETGRSTDMAIVQPGGGEQPVFFVVRYGGGEAYTRNGEFRVEENGYLVTPEGYPVQGWYGAIYTGSDDFSVDTTGRVIIDGRVADTLLVVTFEDPGLLERRGDNLYLAPAELQPLQGVNYQIRQGWLESSNVDVVKEMVDMLSVLRAYEVNQRIIQAKDQLLAKSVTEIGGIS